MTYDRRSLNPVRREGTALNNGPRTSPPGDHGDGREDYYYKLVNSLAHEIRNPLNALSVNLNLLSREIGDGPGAEKLATAIEEIRRLDELLNAFLRFARPKVPKGREVELNRVLAELETFIAPVAATSAVTLAFQAARDVVVNTDPDLLKQALLNVILNSLEAGASRVDIVAGERGDGIVIAVRDDGPGVAEPSRVFEPFYSTKADGSGLGLPTARAIVESLGGRLELGEAPAGTEFNFKIPKKLPIK
jgi:two-component system sensor histidine kinase HydH